MSQHPKPPTEDSSIRRAEKEWSRVAARKKHVARWWRGQTRPPRDRARAVGRKGLVIHGGWADGRKGGAAGKRGSNAKQKAGLKRGPDCRSKAFVAAHSRQELAQFRRVHTLRCLPPPRSASPRVEEEKVSRVAGTSNRPWALAAIPARRSNLLQNIFVNVTPPRVIASNFDCLECGACIPSTVEELLRQLPSIAFVWFHLTVQLASARVPCLFWYPATGVVSITPAALYSEMARPRADLCSRGFFYNSCFDFCSLFCEAAWRNSFY